MRFNATVLLVAPVERVFAYLDDPELLKKWIAGLESLTFDKPGVPRAVGTRFRLDLRESGRRYQVQGEVTAYRPPLEMAARLSSARFTLDVTSRLTADGHVARLEQWVDLTRPGWATRLTRRWADWQRRRQHIKALESLKAAIEHSP